MDERFAKIRRFAMAAGIVLTAMTPLALALTGTEKVPRYRPIQGTVERSSLVFSQYAVNLGEIPPTASIPVHFDFWNRGQRPLKLVQLDPSCGCLAPRLVDDKKTYGVGERGRFYVSVKTANEPPGPKEYTVRVQYNDGAVRNETVRFRMVIPERKVTVTPSEVYFYQLNGQPDSREIRVEDHRGKALDVIGAAVSSENVSVTLGEKYQKGKDVTVTPIRLDVPGHVAPGREIAILTVRTNDEDYAEIKVPVLIQGPEKEIELTGGQSNKKSSASRYQDEP